ncbi:hypothetical protein BTR22_19565 [Alkalihalophilus pseudofirmus]|uniref:hypothetical protein n=1 Tax=Alkalihalophilus pseudofirmus TaxID=79885 RepID=UPI000950DABA|nr:hypothetical protein BTR22_19565 [Alkalihalophilus pseudofirmus]
MLVVYIILGFIISVQLGMTLAANLIGNGAVNFMERSYFKHPRSTFEKLMNIVFYVLYGVPHYMYTRLMTRYTYWKARVLFLLCSILLIFIVFILIVIFGLIVDLIAS